MPRSSALLNMALVLCVVLTACGREKDNARLMVKETGEGVVGSFVGRVDGSDAFVALVTAEENRKTVAYVSDGRSVATWFDGTADANTVDLAGTGGARLTATLSVKAVTGSLVLTDGRVLTFTAIPSSGEAGLYQAKKTLGGLEHVGGWILLPDGEQRGTVVAGGSTFPPSPLIPSNPTVKLPAGTLEAKRINP